MVGVPGGWRCLTGQELYSAKKDDEQVGVEVVSCKVEVIQRWWYKVVVIVIGGSQLIGGWSTVVGGGDDFFVKEFRGKMV